MKKRILSIVSFVIIAIICVNAQLQTEAGFVPGNRTMSASLEKNILFNATSRYTVTQSGATAFTPTQLAALFDGAMEAQYTNVPINSSNPLVITIENLTPQHVQAGAWIGFSTRYWPTYKYKIEGFNTYNGANIWQTFTDINASSEHQIVVSLPQGGFTKIRFTFYEGYPTSQPNGTMGISELYFIHPEAAQAYDGLLLKASSNGFYGIGTTGVPSEKLEVNGNALINGKTIVNEIKFIAQDKGYGTGNSDPYSLRKVHDDLNISHLDLNLNDDYNESFRIYGNSCQNYGCGEYSGNLYHSFDASGNAYHAGKVNIGTTTPDNTPNVLLTVNGSIHAKEVLVDMDILADYVFSPDYSLMPLHKVEAFVKTNKHLPEIPSADEVKEKGLSMGEMQNKLLQKIEELTLYVIEQQKQIEELKAQIVK